MELSKQRSQAVQMLARLHRRVRRQRLYDSLVTLTPLEAL